MIQLDEKKLAKLGTTNRQLDEKYGENGTASRERFNEKAMAWYYGDILRERRKELKLTQKQLAPFAFSILVLPHRAGLFCVCFQIFPSSPLHFQIFFQYLQCQIKSIARYPQGRGQCPSRTEGLFLYPFLT